MTQPGILGQKSNYCTILFVLRHLKSRKKFFPMCRFEERTSPRVGNTGLGCSYPRLRLGKELPQPCVSFPSSSVLSSNLHIGKVFFLLLRCRSTNKIVYKFDFCPKIPGWVIICSFRADEQGGHVGFCISYSILEKKREIQIFKSSQCPTADVYCHKIAGLLTKSQQLSWQSAGQ